MRLPEIGQKFRDRYLVEEVLGEGAFGAVYAATDTIASRPVALKILKPDGDAQSYDPKTRARFDREIKVVANLRSPHTVSLFDCGATDDGLLFSVFERVPGEDLSEHLKRVGRVPIDATVHVARQVLESLQEAHAQGLLHRDIKPHNIRVFRHNNDPLTVKVLDFGLARDMRQDRPVVTEQGEVIGTPRYMAPEQLIDGEITPASDVYSLGVVMLEMLLGVEALHGSKFSDQLERLRTGHVFPVQGLEQSGLAPIITRMTTRDATARFPDATAALRALDQWRSGAYPVGHQDLRHVSASSSGAITRPASVSSSGLTRPAPSGDYATIPAHGSSASGQHGTRENSTLFAIAAGIVLAVVALLTIAYALAKEAEEPPPPPPISRPVSSIITPENPDPPPMKPVAEDLGQPDAAMSGCGAEPRFVGKGYLERKTLLARHRWLTYVPRDYDAEKRYPLVILLHPSGQTPEDLVRYARFDLVAEDHDFVLIAPKDDDPMSWRDEGAEVEMVRRTKDATIDQLCIDEQRVFVVTQGHGGYVANLLACQPWVTGIATNAFRMDQSLRFCSDDVTKPWMLLSPDNGHDPWDGGSSCAGAQKRSVAEVEELWRARNRCKGKRSRTFEYKGSACYSWTCERAFTSCHIKGGHNWPGSPARAMDFVGCDNEAPDFPMAEQVWAFFQGLETSPE